MLDQLIGEHPALRNVRLRLPALAQSCDPLLIVGEPGVGKSLLAAHIHSQSPFAHNKLITIDCSLLEHRQQRISLFGGDLGELSSSRKSPFEHQTTLVIKHPDKLVPYLQDQLANILKTGQAQRFRSSRSFPVLSREIIFLEQTIGCTTDMTTELQNTLHHFRHYHLPPLSHRKNDIPLLVSYFATKAIAHRSPHILKSGKPAAAFLRCAENHTWSGNVAELKVFVDLVLKSNPEKILREKEMLAARQIRMMLHEQKPFSLKHILRSIRSASIQLALENTHGNRIQASHLLGMTESALR